MTRNPAARLASQPGRRFIAISYANAFLPAALGTDVTILSAIVVLSGGTTVQVGLLTLVASLAGLISYVLSPYLLDRFGGRKRMIVALSAVVFLMLVVVALSVLLFRGMRTIASLLASVFLYSFASGCISLPWTDLQRTELPKTTRIRTITQVIAVNLAVTTAATLGIKAILESGLAFPTNYGLVLALGAGLGGISWLTYLFLEDDRGLRTARGLAQGSVLAFYRQELVALSRNRAVQLLFAAVLFYAVGSSSSGLFIGLGYRLAPQEMARVFGTGLVIRMLVKSVAYYVGGRLAARHGNEIVLTFVALAGMVSPLTLLFLPLRYYMLVLIATNLIPMWQPFFTNLLMDISDEERFAGHFAAFMMIPFPISLLVPLLGALAERSPMAFSAVVLVALIAGVALVQTLRARDRAELGSDETSRRA